MMHKTKNSALSPQHSVLSLGFLQRGFSLITAIFLLVVLSGLGAVMLSFFTAQQQSSALDVLGSRAYQAARTGVEWGAFQVIRSGVGGGISCTAAGAANTPPALAGSLATFSVSVTCASSAHTEVAVPAGTLTVYRLTSTATRGAAGQTDYVERQIEVTIAR